MIVLTPYTNLLNLSWIIKYLFCGPFKHSSTMYFTYFSTKNIYCGYSFETPCRDTSNEYPNMLSCRNKKNVNTFWLYIMKTRLYNFDPLQPHFYMVKLGFTGVYIIFLISAQRHRLWVLIRTILARQF